MRNIFTLFIILIYLNVNAQTIPKGFNNIKDQGFELVFYDKSKLVLSVKPDSTMVVIDSLQAIKILYKELLHKQKKIDDLNKLFEESRTTVNCSVKYFNTTHYVYKNKEYKAYLKALSKHGYYPKK